MNKSHYEWKSAISSTIKDFIDDKHLAGYRFRCQERWMKQFDKYCYEKDIHKEHLNSVFDTLKLPKVDGIACPEVDEYNVHEYIPEKGKDASHNV